MACHPSSVRFVLDTEAGTTRIEQLKGVPPVPREHPDDEAFFAVVHKDHVVVTEDRNAVFMIARIAAEATNASDILPTSETDAARVICECASRLGVSDTSVLDPFLPGGWRGEDRKDAAILTHLAANLMFAEDRRVGEAAIAVFDSAVVDILHKVGRRVDDVEAGRYSAA